MKGKKKSEKDDPSETGTITEAQLQALAKPIKVELEKAQGHHIAAGRKLIDVKTKLERMGCKGQFGRMFYDHAEPMKDPFTITLRYGEYLMQIAGHPIVGDPKHVSSLPLDIRSLLVLVRHKKQREVESILDEGKLRPSMKAHDVKLLLGTRPKKSDVKPDETVTSETQVHRHIKKLVRTLWDTPGGEYRNYVLDEIARVKDVQGLDKLHHDALANLADDLARVPDPDPTPEPPERWERDDEGDRAAKAKPVRRVTPKDLALVSDVAKGART
jgi:hypothetical protein